MTDFKGSVIIGLYREEDNELHHEIHKKVISSEEYIDSTDFLLVEDEIGFLMKEEEQVQKEVTDYNYYLVEFTGSLEFVQDYWGEWDMNIYVDLIKYQQVTDSNMTLEMPGPVMPEMPLHKEVQTLDWLNLKSEK